MSSIDKINQLSINDFISIFRNVFEKTDWIAKKAYKFKPFSSFEDLSEKFLYIFKNETKENHLKILNAHPDLAVEKIMTNDSKKEQNNAQLNKCSQKEFEEFLKLNIEYRKKFNFPYIIAVSGKTKKEILESFSERIKKDINTEFEQAKKQVIKIASLRINQIKNL